MYQAFFGGKNKEERMMAWVAWHKLYESKKNGSLEMQNLPIFNKALLAKQAWRITNFPNSMLTKTLKK